MLHYARTTSHQQIVAFIRCGTVKILIARLELVEHVLAYNGTQFHILDTLIEKTEQLLTANSPHTAWHHSFNSSQRRLACQNARIVGHELSFEREPCEVVASVAYASCHEFEATALHIGKPACWVALALQLVAFVICDLFAFSLAELPQRLEV